MHCHLTASLPNHTLPLPDVAFWWASFCWNTRVEVTRLCFHIFPQIKLFTVWCFLCGGSPPASCLLSGSVLLALCERKPPVTRRRMWRHLTHWGRVTHICVNKLTTIGSDNGLSPGRRQTIIWTNAGILLIGPLATNFSVILSEIHTFSFKKMHFKTSSAK